MPYAPGSAFASGFTCRRIETGVATNADSAPSAVLLKNGVVDGAVTVTVSSVSGQPGAYKCTGTIPSVGYAGGDGIQILATATVNGVTDREFIDSFILADSVSGGSGGGGGGGWDEVIDNDGTDDITAGDALRLLLGILAGDITRIDDGTETTFTAKSLDGLKTRLEAILTNATGDREVTARDGT